MFAYPAKAEVNQVVPKSKIYGNAKVPARIEKLFVSQLEKIVWSYKLSVESTNLAATDTVTELEVFSLYLKGNELSEDVLARIDSGIHHPIIFRVYTNDSVRFLSAYKRPSEADSSKSVTSEYFGTDWIKLSSDAGTRLLFPTALDLDGLYEKLLAPLLPLPPRAGETIRAQVERVCEAKKLHREIVRLESRLRKEKQFNRKVETNRDVNELKAQLALLEV